MNTKLKRPPSVWLAQALLMIFAVVFIFSLLLNIAFGLRRAGGIPIIAVLMLCAVNLGLVMLFLTSFWGLARRKNYGRWLGVGSLSLIWILMLLGQVFRPQGPFPYYEYTNTTQVVAAAVATVCFNGLFLLLIFRLAFAKSVTDFFRPTSEATLNIPPEPPSFP
jgi:hypothetical protein